MSEIYDIISHLEIASSEYAKRKWAQFHAPIWPGQRETVWHSSLMR